MDPNPEANLTRTTATSQAEGRLVVDAGAQKKRKMLSLKEKIRKVRKQSSAPEN